LSIYSRTGTTNDFVFLKGTGTDSIVQKVTNDGVHTQSTVAGAYSVAFGDRNEIASGASESGAFGGDIHIFGANTYGFGYHVWAHDNQNLLGGYDIGSNAKESLIFGNNIGIDCTHNPSTHVWTANNTSDSNKSRYLAVFGKNHIISSDCQSDLFYGSNLTIPQYVYRSLIGGYGTIVHGALENSFIVGESHHLGSNGSDWVNVLGYNNKIGLVDPIGDTDAYSGGNLDVNVFGYQNRIGAYLTDSTIIGYYNKIAGGSSSESAESVYAIGYSNTNKPSNTVYQRVFMIGAYLRAKASDRVIVGRYNDGNNLNNAYFEVGTGTAENNRRSSFAVAYNNNNGHHIYIGSTTLKESELTDIKNYKTYVDTKLNATVTQLLDGTYSLTFGSGE